MTRPAHGGIPPWSLAIASMLSVQLGSALSVGLVGEVGAAGTAWLRLTLGAVIFLLIARPPLRDVRRADLPSVIGLGVTSGLMAIAFLGALERIPLGTAVAIEFLGPLSVAAVRSHRAKALAWPGLALVGIVLLTQPWHGEIDPIGVAYAVAAAVGWACYILLTQRVGDRFDGIRGLSLTIPIAALTAAIVGVPQASGHLTLHTLVVALGLALLLPVLPFALEMLALRRMTHHAFGTLMALEPAFGLVIGLVVLAQRPSPGQVLGIVLVVLAGAGAQRGGRRTPQGEAQAGEKDTPSVVAGA